MLGPVNGRNHVSEKRTRFPVHSLRRRWAPQVLDRWMVAANYLRGDGIEIGALHLPLRVPSSARVKYVDRMTVEELRTHYPELQDVPLVAPDIIDDGEELSTFDAQSQDFVIANHFLEHCSDPIGTLKNLLRVLKTGGVLYLAVPDKRHTFDHRRPVTTIDHLLRDHAEGSAWSREQHFSEWVRLVLGIEDEDEFRKHHDHLMAMDYSIHFHVWTGTELLELLASVRRVFSLPFEVELFLRNNEEYIMILRRNEE